MRDFFILGSIVLLIGVSACDASEDHGDHGNHGNHSDHSAPTDHADHAEYSDHDDHVSSHHDEVLELLSDDGILPVIDVRMTWMTPHPNGRNITAAYLTVYLESGSADRLTGVQIDGADRVEMHGHQIDANGVMSMIQIGPQTVTDQGPMAFLPGVPGARHLMVFGLETVVEGDAVTGRLIFERAGIVDVVFAVHPAFSE